MQYYVNLFRDKDGDTFTSEEDLVSLNHAANEAAKWVLKYNCQWLALLTNGRAADVANEYVQSSIDHYEKLTAIIPEWIQQDYDPDEWEGVLDGEEYRKSVQQDWEGSRGCV